MTNPSFSLRVKWEYNGYSQEKQIRFLRQRSATLLWGAGVKVVVGN